MLRGAWHYFIFKVIDYCVIDDDDDEGGGDDDLDQSMLMFLSRLF